MWSAKVYYQEHKEELRIKARNKYWNNRDQKLSYAKQYRDENKDKIKTNNKKHNGTEEHKKAVREYRKVNKEHISIYNREYKKLHPEKRIESENKRRARKFGCAVDIPSGIWKQALDFYGSMCLCCGTMNIKLTQDHVIPLSKGGKHSIENIQPLCFHCNCTKNTKTIDYRNGKIFYG